MKTLLLALLIATQAAPNHPVAKAPVLTAEQKKDLLLAAKDVEIAQLRLDAAQRALSQLVTASTPAGYQLTERLELVPLPPTEKTP